jgi:hypothetical protein
VADFVGRMRGVRADPSSVGFADIFSRSREKGI